MSKEDLMFRRRDDEKSPGEGADRTGPTTESQTAVSDGTAAATRREPRGAMLQRDRVARRERGVPLVGVRGGVSAGAILTGVLVAFGAMFLLSGIVAGVLVALDVLEEGVESTRAIEVGVGAGIALVVTQLLAYLWGGYTAGRMGRGAGIGNGLAVPLVAILLALIIGAVVAALGATAQFNLPFSDTRLPVEDNFLIDLGVGVGIASLVAMFLGGAIGGAMGARWHTKLERRAEEEEIAQREAERREIDLRDREARVESERASTARR
jgi:hypothetical protein